MEKPPLGWLFHVLVGATVSDAVINGCVGAQLMSSLLAVTCVTVAFCSNLLMIRDKTRGAIHDLTITPVRFGVLGLGYYIATLVSTLIISFTATGACLIYMSFAGWYFTAGDVFLLLLDVLLLTIFGTALSSYVNFFLTTDGRLPSAPLSAPATASSAGIAFATAWTATSPSSVRTSRSAPCTPFSRAVSCSSSASISP